MRIIAMAPLRAFVADYPDAGAGLRNWETITRHATFHQPLDVVNAFPNAKAINGERVRFAIAGGKYRLVVAYKWTAQIAFVKFIGTHADYDKIDPETVSNY
jgi:mRNA interferase HigB